jgi:hypothetical protein
MKFFGYLMAFLVLSLSCFPCADNAPAAMNESKTEMSMPAHPQDNHEDNCSPFCQCSCCSGFSINHFITFFSPSPIICSKDFPVFRPAGPSKISLPVWQPPDANHLSRKIQFMHS